jgi:hypothetical protein
MDDKLREHCIECLVREGQMLRRSVLHVCSRKAVPCCGNERLGRVDGADRVGADSVDELRREGAGTAAHIQDALSNSNAREVGKLR